MEQVQRLALASGGSLVVSGQPPRHAEFAEDVGHVELGVEASEQWQRSLIPGDGGLVIPAELLHETEVGQRNGLRQSIARSAPGKSFPMVCLGGLVIRGVLVHEAEMVERISSARLAA